MNIVYIQLGSNIGDRMSFIEQSLDLIKKNIGEILDESKIYESSPWGVKNQSYFLNSIIKVSSILSAKECLKKSQEIEKIIGRIRKKKWGARQIDIDLLFFNNEIISTDNLIIPHPHITERKFVLVPLAEIDGNYIHPKLKKNIFALLIQCKDVEKVSVYEV